MRSANSATNFRYVNNNGNGNNNNANNSNGLVLGFNSTLNVLSEGVNGHPYLENNGCDVGKRTLLAWSRIVVNDFMITNYEYRNHADNKYLHNRTISK